MQVVSHKDYKSRAEFDSVLHEKLVAADVDIVCLAGFMRILTGKARNPLHTFPRNFPVDGEAAILLQTC